MAKTTVDFYLDTYFPTCSLVMCLWMTMPHVINLRQQFGGFLSVSKLMAGTVYIYICVCVHHSNITRKSRWSVNLQLLKNGCLK